MYMPPRKVEFDGHHFDYSKHINPELPAILWMAACARRGDRLAHQALTMAFGAAGELRDADGRLYWPAQSGPGTTSSDDRDGLTVRHPA